MRILNCGEIVEVAILTRRVLALFILPSDSLNYYI
jgi:hypothetical protein